MNAVVVDDDGAQWWSTAYACAQLGVKAHNLRDWVRRSAAVGHTNPSDGPCPRCAAGEPGFPHIDRPRRRRGVAAYAAEQLLDAEAHTATASRGRRRAA